MKRKKTRESKNRIVRGFSRLKKKYYTPKVRRALKKTGRGLARIERGSNSLVGGSDPYGISSDYFDSWDSNKFEGSPRPAPVMRTRPVKRRKAVLRARTTRRTARPATRVVRRARPRPQKRDRFESNYSLGHDPRPARDNIFGVGSDYWDNN
jgi:hypothetical protein